LLLANGADSAVKDNYGWKAQHLAAMNRHGSVMQLLLGNNFTLQLSTWDPTQPDNTEPLPNAAVSWIEQQFHLNKYWRPSDDPLPSNPSNLEERAVMACVAGQPYAFGLPTPEPSQSPLEGQSENLCSTCKVLGLSTEHFLPREPYHTRIPREGYHKLFNRSLADIKNEVRCPLCRLIHDAVEAACHAQNLDTIGLHCVLSMVKFSCFWDNEKRCESFRFLSVECENLLRRAIGTKISADLVPRESERYPSGFVGRVVDPIQISPQMVRAWLQHCEQFHGPKCSRLENPDALNDKAPPLWNQFRFERLLPSLLFVDVVENCLTRIPSGGRYITLSYVWGDCDALRALKSTVNVLLQPSSLLQVQDQLSTTIKDAMILVQAIGERYLWVDSLCIVQDDIKVKQDTIGEMDLVYLNSFLTIIAVTGNNSNAGLPGVRPGTRNMTQKSAMVAPGLELIVPHSLKALTQTCWASRAWTYVIVY
jgi:hypothetical protein